MEGGLPYLLELLQAELVPLLSPLLVSPRGLLLIPGGLLLIAGGCCYFVVVHGRVTGSCFLLANAGIHKCHYSTCNTQLHHPTKPKPYIPQCTMNSKIFVNACSAVISKFLETCYGMRTQIGRHISMNCGPSAIVQSPYERKNLHKNLTTKGGC